MSYFRLQRVDKDFARQWRARAWIGVAMQPHITVGIYGNRQRINIRVGYLHPNSELPDKPRFNSSL